MKVGDKITVEIEEIRTEIVDRFATNNTVPMTFVKLKGIPMLLSEEDVLELIGGDQSRLNTTTSK